MHLGLIGFGHLGKAIAGRLLDCGHTLTVWNRTPARLEGVPVEIATSPRVVADKAEITLLCLFDSQAVREVLSSSHGLLDADLNGKLIVDLTTNHFREVLDFHEAVRRAGGSYLESPVLGSVVPASKGALTVLASGSRPAYEQARPVLENLGQHLFHLPEPGLATKMKLINNLALGSIMATLAEALAFGEKVGIAKSEVLEILGVGGGKSLVLDAKKANLLKEEFSPHFSSALIYKDLHCLQDLAFQERQPLFTAAVAKELFARTFEVGIDQEDFSAVYKLFKNS